MVDAFSDRFENKYIPITETGCWIWVGALNSHGYGNIRINKKYLRAHRVIYEFYKDKIPDGLDLDHLCRVRCCVNPNHLEPVTRKENLKRGIGPRPAINKSAEISRAKTHCPHGHPYSLENTYWQGNRRSCRICRNRPYLRRLSKDDTDAKP